MAAGGAQRNPWIGCVPTHHPARPVPVRIPRSHVDLGLCAPHSGPALYNLADRFAGKKRMETIGHANIPGELLMTVLETEQQAALRV